MTIPTTLIPGDELVEIELLNPLPESDGANYIYMAVGGDGEFVIGASSVMVDMFFDILDTINQGHIRGHLTGRLHTSTGDHYGWVVCLEIPDVAQRVLDVESIAVVVTTEQYYGRDCVGAQVDLSIRNNNIMATNPEGLLTW